MILIVRGPTVKILIVFQAALADSSLPLLNSALGMNAMCHDTKPSPPPTSTFGDVLRAASHLGAGDLHPMDHIARDHMINEDHLRSGANDRLDDSMNTSDRSNDGRNSDRDDRLKIEDMEEDCPQSAREREEVHRSSSASYHSHHLVKQEMKDEEETNLESENSRPISMHREPEGSLDRGDQDEELSSRHSPSSSLIHSNNNNHHQSSHRHSHHEASPVQYRPYHSLLEEDRRRSRSPPPPSRSPSPRSDSYHHQLPPSSQNSPVSITPVSITPVSASVTPSHVSPPPHSSMPASLQLIHDSHLRNAASLEG